MSYDGLANADVTLGKLTTALKAGTTSQALSTQISYADLLSAVVAALTANSKDPGAEAAISVLGTIQAALPVYLPHTLTLGQLLSVADPGGAAVADASVDVWALVTGGAEIANGQHFLTVPGFKATVPNLLAGLPVGVTNPKLVSVTASLAAIQPPQTAYGPVGTSAHTAQVVAQAEAKITADIGLGPLSVVAVTLDVPVTVVGAAATS
ncbi:MAG: hypothetical protein ACRDZY_03780, partial [Acidimicrobiales bacterium]